jgi:DNA mismatch repair ATPase MutL
LEKEKIAPWLERLNAEPDGKKRNGIVAEMCKEHGLRIGDAWKLLKEAGFDPKSSHNGEQNNGEQNNNEQNSSEQNSSEQNNSGQNNSEQNSSEKNNSGQNNNEQNSSEQNNSGQNSSGQETGETAILASHKTAYEKYRCAGLVLTKKPENYLVTAEQLKKLQRDPWVVLEGKEKK